MRIGNPIGTLQSQRQLSTIAKAFARSLERLSSGKRINSSRDGAAELAISSGLEAQQRALRQVVRNINDAKGYSNTLAGVISTQSEIVQRLKELALQSANGVLNSEQRAYLNTEFQQLYSEFNRLAEQSEFNGEKIADGQFLKRIIQAGTRKGESIDLSLPSLLAKDIFVEYRGSGSFDPNFFQTWNGSNLLFTNAGDINGDGLLDNVGGIADTTYAHLSLGDGSFSAPITSFTISGYSPTWTTIADINNDDKGDIVQTTTNGYIVVALGNGDGNFQAPRTFDAASGNSREIQAGDLDGDGNLDLVVGDFNAAATVSIYYGNGDGSFQTRATFSTPATAYGIELVDINEDGRVDILAGTASTGYVFLNQGNKTFSSNTFAFASTSMDIADLNNDGHKDMLFSVSNQNYFGVALGNGDGTFQAPVTYLGGDRVIDSVFADLNGDGYLDAAWSNNNTGGGGYAFGSENGTFSNIQTFSGPTSNNFFMDDVNQDGANDLVFSGGTRNRTYLGIPELKSAIDKMDISNQDAAEDVLSVLDNALQQLAGANAVLGAITNRLDSSESVSLNLAESLAASRSQIEDTDYSQEMAEFTRLQILQSATLAVMNQNNLNMRLVLELLQF